MAEKKDLKTKFTGVTLRAFSRRNGKGGTATFSSNFSEKFRDYMKWEQPNDKETSVSLDGSLAAKEIRLICSTASFDKPLDATIVASFQFVRRELEGKKDKGFRHELHFKVKFADQKGARTLEEYMLAIPEGKGVLDVLHTKGGDDDEDDEEKQGSLLTEEQKKAVAAESD